MTEAGLNTVNLSTLNVFQQVMLFCLIIVGSTVRHSSVLFYLGNQCLMAHLYDLTQVWVSIAIVFVRRRAFEKRFSDIVEEQQRLRKQKGSLSLRRLSSASLPRSVTNNSLGLLRSRSFRTEPKEQRSTMQPDHDHRDSQSNMGISGPLESDTVLQKRNMSNDGSQDEQKQGQQDDSAPNQITFASDVQDPSPTAYQRNLRPPYTNVRSQVESQEGSHNEVAADHHYHFLDMFGRNSSFHHLSEAERRRLGGVEYRAICLLSVIVPLHSLTFGD